MRRLVHVRLSGMAEEFRMADSGPFQRRTCPLRSADGWALAQASWRTPVTCQETLTLPFSVWMTNLPLLISEAIMAREKVPMVVS